MTKLNYLDAWIFSIHFGISKRDKILIQSIRILSSVDYIQQSLITKVDCRNGVTFSITIFFILIEKIQVFKESLHQLGEII